MTTLEDSLLKGDEMLFVLVIYFAVGNVCYVHNCNDKHIDTFTVRLQTEKDELIN